MFRRYLLPLLAIIGVFLGVNTVKMGQKKPPVQIPVALPAESPFRRSVAGAGIIEAESENIQIASAVSGLVTAVHVKTGSKVKTGDPLFSLDDRSIKADLEVRKASLLVRKSLLEETREQLKIWEAVAVRKAVSQNDLIQRQYAVKSAEAQVLEAQALVTASQIELDRLIVRAPIDGEVLRVNVRVGEFAPAQSLSTPLMVMGSTALLRIRTDVDENDAWRVRQQAKARAYLRGNRSVNTDLAFVRFEPLVVPKRSLTGDSTERVDTRVLQIIYAFDPASFPAFVGQLVDVYIDAPEEPAK